MTGPRAHVLGVIRGFESLGYSVKSFIVGDRVPEDWITAGSDRRVRRGLMTRIAADVVRIAFNFRNSRIAEKEIGDVDWVYERFGAFQALGYRFKRKGIPWILETNAPLFYESKEERKSLALAGLARIMELWAYRQCDVLICISETLKKILVDSASISSSKILVMPNGVDVSKFTPGEIIPRRFFADIPVLGFIGNLIHWQGLGVLLDVLAELRDCGKKIGCVVVGDGPQRNEWEEQAKSLDLQEQIVFTGRIPWEDVPTYLAGFDLGYTGQVNLSIGQMYLSPLKLYEYGAMALPVVAAAHEDARRVVDDGVTGFLYDPGDREDLKNTLIAALQRRAEWPLMGQRARQRIEEEHSWNARIRSLVDVILCRSKMDKDAAPNGTILASP